MTALVALAAVGLGVALYLPARGDSASASENGYRSSSGWRHKNHPGDNSDRRRNREARESASASADPTLDPSAVPSEEPPVDPSATPTDTVPPTSEAPTLAPTTEPTTPPTTPPTSEPTAEPTTAPTTPPASKAPAAKAWAAFTIYLPGQRVTFGGKTYQVLAAHTSLPGWEPPKLPALFKVIG